MVLVLACVATAIGILYPYITTEPQEEAPDISKVMRCVAVFVGIYQASTVSSTQCVSQWLYSHLSFGPPKMDPPVMLFTIKIKFYGVGVRS